MQTRDTQAEQVQLWITVAQQPGVAGWLNVWLVSRFRRPPRPRAAAEKKLPRGACAA
ncbi:MAG TPA: hypothetical protein VLV87_05950 [Gammaproteobacteria bacterium]|nr:hypothetical protein [Gammaproteobacteria bacterium]